MTVRRLLTACLFGLAAQGSAWAASPTAGPTVFEAEIGATKAAMMARPEDALSHARRAESLLGGSSARVGDPRGATVLWLQGEALTRLKRANEALPLLNRALDTAERTAPNSKLLGDVLKSRGRASASLGRVQSALSDYQSAFHIYQRANEQRSEALALQEIGSLYLDAGDYDHVLAYYRQAAEVFSADPQLNLSAHNNLGFALKDLGRLPEAEVEFRRADEAAKTLGSSLLQAQILTNLSYTQALEKRPGVARATAAQGLELANRDPEARIERPFLLGVLAKIEGDEGDWKSAADLLSQTFAGVDLTTSPMDYRDFHAIAAQVYEATGDRARALAHLKAFKRLDDEGRALAASTNAALMAARFDFANQDLKITKLKAGQLERDVALARSQARLRGVLIAGVLLAGGGVLAVTVVGFLSMRASRDRIRVAHAELGVANAALERALRAKTDFLASTSHEIRTPLNGIIGMTQVVLADQELKPALRDRLQLVQGAGETMKALVDDLLDVAKIENGSLVLDPAPTNLPKLLADARAFWTDQAEAKGLTVALRAEGAPKVIVADATRLRQVLFNLMSNAVKFTDAGSVTLKAYVADETLVLQVVDTGIGIPTSEHQRIFEPFTQVDAGTSRRYGGTGLGLSICDHICTAMGGSVSVESVPGEGAAFTVRVPLVLAAAPEQRAADRLGAAHVLVVDPNLLAQSILKATLAPATASVAAVGGDASAHAHLSTAAVDLLILDHAALAANGCAGAALSRLREAAPGARTVVLCPAASRDAEPLLIAAGADRVVMKPVTAADLLHYLGDLWSPVPAVQAAA